jgi:formylglycine-generating enzyme required for sulfatase activity
MQNRLSAANTPKQSMIWIPGGVFAMGSNRHYVEEAPTFTTTVAGFWIDRTPVTNDEFRAFVAATGYRTLAETQPDPNDYPRADVSRLTVGSLVFDPPEDEAELRRRGGWWTFRRRACWWRPDGYHELDSGRDHHPVVHIAYVDACAYAGWVGKSLPTEAEWEFAARGGGSTREFAWGDELTPGGRRMANIWLSRFPLHKAAQDLGTTSPVGVFPANGYGLYDMIGNVWEWCADRYNARQAAAVISPCCAPTRYERGSDVRYIVSSAESSPVVSRQAIKGGSHLCAPNYCQRYRPAARQPQPVDSATSHLGFRCVSRRPLSTKETL